MDKDTATVEQIDLTDRKEKIDKAVKGIKEDDQIVFPFLPFDVDKELKSYCLAFLMQEKQDIDTRLEETTLWLDTCYETEREAQEQVRREIVSI